MSQRKYLSVKGVVFVQVKLGYLAILTELLHLAPTLCPARLGNPACKILNTIGRRLCAPGLNRSFGCWAPRTSRGGRYKRTSGVDRYRKIKEALLTDRAKQGSLVLSD